jgi:hypothetical protein
MAFMANPRRYRDDRSRVVYAVLYLDYVAHSWFEPYIFASEPAPFMDDWSLFEKEITAMFGDPDEIATAERRI